MTWAGKQGIHIQYIQPKKSQQNANIERYNRTVRVEWLGQNIFETIEEAQEQATEWLWTYNNPSRALLRNARKPRGLTSITWHIRPMENADRCLSPHVLQIAMLSCEGGATAWHVLSDGQWRGSDRSPLSHKGPSPSMVAPVFSDDHCPAGDAQHR